MIEGALTFKPTMTRKLGSSSHTRMSYPFTVEPSSIGSAVSTDDERIREQAPARSGCPFGQRLRVYGGAVSLLREGACDLAAKAPRDGLDIRPLHRQVLGVDRGMSGFQRFMFLKRVGDNDLAVPLSRFRLAKGSAPKVGLIADLERGNFLDLLRRAARSKDAPASLRRAVSKLENALFGLTRPGAGQQAIQRTLILHGEVMQILAVSRKGQEAVTVLPNLSPAWIYESSDNSVEFRLALALASLQGMCAHIAPIERSKTSRRWQWQADSRLHVWGEGDLTRNLVCITHRRIIEATRQDDDAEPFGVHAALGARQADIQAFIARETHDDRISELLQGLIWIRLSDSPPQSASWRKPADAGCHIAFRRLSRNETLLRARKATASSQSSTEGRSLVHYRGRYHIFSPPITFKRHWRHRLAPFAHRGSRVAGGVCPEITTADGRRFWPP